MRCGLSRRCIDMSMPFAALATPDLLVGQKRLATTTSSHAHSGTATFSESAH